MAIPRLNPALVLVASLVLSAGCGGSALRVSSPLTARDAEVFDDGADYLPDPAAFTGALAEETGAELDARCARADVVLLGTVRAVRLDRAGDGRRTVRVQVGVDARLLGEYPRPEILLHAAETEAGFDSLEDHDRQLLSRQVLVFVKWVDRDGIVAPRFHVSPASEGMQAAVQQRLRARRAE